MSKRRKEINLLNKKLRCFSRYEEGIQLSDEMLYSVTPELVAHKLAQEYWAKGFKNVVDGCGGCGGNSIAFAETGFSVALVELNPQTLEDAKTNAQIYGVEEWIKFYNESILEFDCRSAGFDPQSALFFSSPEWGGPSYKNQEVFDLEEMNPPISQILDYAERTGYEETVIYVPRTSNIQQASELGCYQCEYLFIEGWCVAMCLSFHTAAQ